MPRASGAKRTITRDDAILASAYDALMTPPLGHPRCSRPAGPRIPDQRRRRAPWPWCAPGASSSRAARRSPAATRSTSPTAWRIGPTMLCLSKEASAPHPPKASKPQPINVATLLAYRATWGDAYIETNLINGIFLTACRPNADPRLAKIPRLHPPNGGAPARPFKKTCVGARAVRRQGRSTARRSSQARGHR